MELAPGKRIETIGFNGTAPGPVLRLREGREVTMEVANATEVQDVVHWHGLMIPSDVDGAMEEGTPMVPAGGSRRYTFTPRPAGTRWYHTHAKAGRDLGRGLYAGEFGFLIVEPAQDPGRYDQEVLLAAHHWEPRWAKPPSQKNGSVPLGLGIDYASASFNDKMLGHGEPVRVRPGQRVLFRLLNASATRPVRLALPGHTFNVIALDGNAVASPKAVEVLSLAPAERADVVVDMQHPGVWILGEIEKNWREKGLGVVVEYAGQHGEPAWSNPAGHKWDYTEFGGGASPQRPDETITLDVAMTPPGPDGINRWTINGKSFPHTDRIIVEKGKRYRVVLNNKSDMPHPVHLHRHSFELTKFDGKPMAGVIKDTVDVSEKKSAEFDFTADDPGLTLLHCHQQDHQDFGFMTLLAYSQSA